MWHFIAALVLAQTAGAPPVVGGAIQGIVIRGGASVPLAKATLELRAEGDPEPPASGALGFRVPTKSLFDTTSENDGRFVFPNVRPGRYRILTTRPGYVRRLTSVTVTARTTTSVQIALTA